MKYCIHCGKEIKNSDNFCPYCDYKQQNNTNIRNNNYKPIKKATYNNDNNPSLNNANDYAKTILHRITAKNNGSALISIIDLGIIGIFIWIYGFSVAHINSYSTMAVVSSDVSKSERHSLLMTGLIILIGCIVIFSLRSVARTLGIFMLIVSVIGIVILLIIAIFGNGESIFPYYYGPYGYRSYWDHWHRPWL